MHRRVLGQRGGSLQQKKKNKKNRNIHQKKKTKLTSTSTVNITLLHQSHSQSGFYLFRFFIFSLSHFLTAMDQEVSLFQKSLQWTDGKNQGRTVLKT